MKKLIIILLFFIAHIGLQAQQTDPDFVGAGKIIPVTLETVLKLAGADNLKIAEFNAKYELAKARKLEAKEWFLPTISPGLLLMSYSGYAQNTDGSFINEFVDGSSKNFIWTGVGVTANWDFGDKVYKYLAAKQEVTGADYARQAETNQRVLEAVKAFFDLSAAQSKLTALQKVATKSEDIVRQIEVQVIQGIRYKSDVLLAKANLNHIKIEVSRSNMAILEKSNKLMNILNIKDDAVLFSSDTLLVPVDIVDSSQVDVSVAYSNRPEVLQVQSNIESLTISRKSTTTGLLLPAINLGLNDGLLGPYFNPLGNRFTYTAGLQWNVPLGLLFFGGSRKQYDARIQIERIRLDQTKNNVRQEVSDAYAMLDAVKKQMRLAAEALGFANEALDQSMQRQKLGMALPLEVFQAQKQLVEAEIDNITAISEYNKAQYSLYVALGNKF